MAEVRRPRSQSTAPLAPRAPEAQLGAGPAPAPPMRQRRATSPGPGAVAAPVQKNAALGPGSRLQIAGQIFVLTEPLGEGSFGVVWAALDERGGRVAVKEIPCRSDSELRRVLVEGQLLQIVERELCKWKSGGETLRVPRLVASDVEQGTGGSRSRVRLVMSQVAGIPLEQFLETSRRAERERAGLPNRVLRQQIAEACRYTGELLVQLAPILEGFSNKVYHRDVTPRNILIQEHRGKEGPQFGLVDFGLAVNASKWRAQGEGSGDLGGDGRYWPASAWFVFSYGTQALQKHPAMFHEYRTCLDVHSLGLTAFRCLMEMMPTMEKDTDIPGAEHAVPKLRALRVAWTKLWSDSRRFWQPVFDAFRGNGDFESLRSAYINAGVHRVVSADMRAVRVALQEARHACRNMAPETGLAGMPALFDALLLMLQASREGEPKAPSAVLATPDRLSATTPAESRRAAEAYRTPPQPRFSRAGAEVQDATGRSMRWTSVSTTTPDGSPCSAAAKGADEDGGSTTTASEGETPRTAPARPPCKSWGGLTTADRLRGWGDELLGCQQHPRTAARFSSHGQMI